MRKYFLLFVLSITAAKLTAQVDTASTNDDSFQQQIENLSENLATEDADYSNIEENLKYYLDHPLNLNTATREELQDLTLLDEVQINNLIEHRNRFGSLISIYELQSIDGFDLATIYKILPYVRVTDRTDSGHFSFSEMRKNGKNDLSIREQRVLQVQKGYSPIDSAGLAASPNSRYLGSPDHIYLRYRYTYSNFVSIGFIADKDAGEQFFNGTQKRGFDFYAGHLCVRNIGFVKTAVAGDYQVSFGQGLTAWTGYAFGKTAFVMSTKRSAMGIRPYTSSDENKFLRGGATTLRFGRFEGTAFYSQKYRDANIALTSDTTGGKVAEIVEVSSLQITGLHSTPAELADRHAIRETIFGGNISYKGKRLQLGITGMQSMYNANLKRSLSLYNQFEFSAQKNLVIGTDYDFSFRNFHFYGEGARSANGGLAFINGVLISLDPRLAFTVHQRYFARNFQNIYANAFSESTTLANEQGIYFGITAKPHRKITLSAYIDRYRFPWLRFQTSAPAYGSDFLFQINYTPDKKTDMYFRYRHRDKFIDAGDNDAAIDYVIPITQDNWRFQIQYPVTPSIRLRNRVEFSRYHKSNAKASNGFAIWQDVTYKKLGSPVSVTMRYALMQTDSYDAAIYAYENDMPFTYSVPAYYYKGSRMYLLLNWDVSRNFEIYFRIAQTIYNNQQVISEGSLTEIQGNTKTDAKVMLRLKF
jgi:DNA uptake protein ComE-like DNA-binding protein